MSYQSIALVGAGGKMGMRISDNLAQSSLQVHYCENAPEAQQRVRDAGRSVTAVEEIIEQCDLVILAVPDIVLGKVSEQLVPRMKAGATLLTLDPAAAYAGLLHQRGEIHYAVAHPCHPSVFLERYTEAEHADAFGGVAATQSVAAAFEAGDESEKAALAEVIRVMYAPVDEVHWVTVTQLAYLEPTLVETVTCMVGTFMKEALEETVSRSGVSREAAEAMLYGHIQIALAVAFRSSNPFSDACMVAIDYGRENILKDDWKKIFDQQELDRVIARMLKIDRVRRDEDSPALGSA
ncbi:acetohydroxy acid isomeroreductase-like protein [Kushneria sinocarnis]|uniref:Acetohydroxy acid isomeroreductase-like protein n=1 Tax=Kushneria sinocarnis TaxID=595502 RepID=A0A420X0B0_9GAMM|nr:phosphogluconate dehydrogenase C-terminal domain-containing protein [Kushneria sinocarnis]RKR07214.1 acetohydroxy acid isomeroreductase-like protein [Kushneria sinocarnis]